MSSRASKPGEATMPRRSWWLVCLIPTLSASCGDRPAPRPDAVSQATASVTSYDSAGQRYWKATSQRYSVVRRPGSYEHPRRWLLLHEQTERRCCVEGEREAWGTLSLEAWPDTAPPGSPPLWRAKVTADEGEVLEDFYRAVLHGCCDESDELLFFNLSTGGPVYVTSTRDRDHLPDLPRIHGPRYEPRFIAYHDIDTEDNPPEAVSDSSVMGVLQYGSVDRALARVVVRRARPDSTFYRLMDMGFVLAGKDSIASDASLPATPGDTQGAAAFTGFSVRVVLVEYDHGEVVIDIPVVRDSLDLEHARMPRTLVLARSKLK